MQRSATFFTVCLFVALCLVFSFASAESEDSERAQHLQTHTRAGDTLFPKADGQRLCFVSDMNGSYGSIDLPSSVHSGIARLSQMNCSIVVGAGDLVAGQDDRLNPSHLNAMWQEWKRVVADPLLEKGIPVLSALGNHDASAERSRSGDFIYQRERTAALEFWQAQVKSPQLSGIRWMSREHFPFYYSFLFGSLGVVVFDGSAAGEVTRQRAWLEQQLIQLSQHQSVTTRIVVGHLPLFAVAVGRAKVGEILQNSWLLYELFNQYRVDFYASGHHHAFYPATPANGADSYGTVQLALGALGGGPRPLLGTSATTARHSVSVLDVLEQGSQRSRMSGDHFRLSTFSPLTGEIQRSQDLPPWLDSIDGRGEPLTLRRFDF